MMYRNHYRPYGSNVFVSQAMPGSIARADFRGYGQDEEPAIPAKYVAYGALGIAGIALLIAIASR